MGGRRRRRRRRDRKNTRQRLHARASNGELRARPLPLAGRDIRTAEETDGDDVWHCRPAYHSVLATRVKEGQGSYTIHVGSRPGPGRAWPGKIRSSRVAHERRRTARGRTTWRGRLRRPRAGPRLDLRTPRTAAAPRPRGGSRRRGRPAPRCSRRTGRCRPRPWPAGRSGDCTSCGPSRPNPLPRTNGGP